MGIPGRTRDQQVVCENQRLTPEEVIKRSCSMRRDTLCADLWYPRMDVIKAIEIDLIDVRASQSIRIEFDFERNGWVVKQSIGQKDGIDQWKEAAFLEAESPDWKGCPTCGEVLEGEGPCLNCGQTPSKEE